MSVRAWGREGGGVVVGGARKVLAPPRGGNGSMSWCEVGRRGGICSARQGSAGRSHIQPTGFYFFSRGQVLPSGPLL